MTDLSGIVSIGPARWTELNLPYSMAIGHILGDLPFVWCGRFVAMPGMHKAAVKVPYHLAFRLVWRSRPSFRLRDLILR